VSATQAARAIAVLREVGVPVDDGLTESEVARVEDAGGFSFNPDHRAFLQHGLPTGDRWPDWRDASASDVRAMLARFIDSVLFDVENNEYWESAWGAAPDEGYARLEAARGHLDQAPRLVPIYAHRACVAAPAPAGSPIFSAYQTDVIVYGSNLLDYVCNEFGLESRDTEDLGIHVPYWSELVDQVDYNPASDAARAFWAGGQGVSNNPLGEFT
jgi:hypothetical protein